MSVFYLDSFQAFNGIATDSTSLQNQYSLSHADKMLFSTGRFSGTRSLQLQMYATDHCYAARNFSPNNTVTAGFALKPVDLNSCNIAQIMTAGLGSNIFALSCDATGLLSIVTPSATTSTGFTVSVGTWYFIEMVLTGGSSGSAAVYVNGTLANSQSGNYGAGIPAVMVLGSTADSGGSATGHFQFSDLYLSSTAASLGDCRVQVQSPASNSSVTWTPLTGTNWSEVNELPVDGDTSYVSTSTAGNQDLYTVTALGTTPSSVKAVQIRTCMRKSDASAHTAASAISSSGTVSVGATQSLGASYSYGTDIYLTDPHTSAAWTGAALNALLIGQKLIS